MTSDARIPAAEADAVGNAPASPAATEAIPAAKAPTRPMAHHAPILVTVTGRSSVVGQESVNEPTARHGPGNLEAGPAFVRRAALTFRESLTSYLTSERRGRITGAPDLSVERSVF